MKARVKATGEILNNAERMTDQDGARVVYGYNKNGHGVKIPRSEVELVDDNYVFVNWDEKLIHLSGMAMQGYCSNHDPHNSNCEEVAMFSIMQAKALIEQLKEELKAQD